MKMLSTQFLLFIYKVVNVDFTKHSLVKNKISVV